MVQKELKKGDFLNSLLKSKKTVFSAKDACLIWSEPKIQTVKSRLNYYVKNKKLIHLRRGLYAKDENYNKYELAVKILKPSYVSFETILGNEGVTFQYYDQIFVASYIKREIICDGQKYSFVRIPKKILIDPTGIDQSKNYSKASKERAFLDTIYRSKDYYFDNQSSLNWEKIFKILPIYENKKMQKTVEKYYKNYVK